MSRSRHDGPREGARWSTWDSRSRPSGPESHPDWLVTDLAAVDTELGIRKIGKEADVFLLRRGEPAGRSCLLAARQYRTAEHRMVHRDSGCLEGRRTRQSRGGTGDGEPEHVRAAGHRGPTGQGRVRRAGPAVRGRAPVPTPVQVLDTELLLEFIGAADGTAAPQRPRPGPGAAELAGLWDQLVPALVALAGRASHTATLLAYNLLVHDGRLAIIAFPRVVDVIANPRGAFYLTRDAENMGRWFAARGLVGVRRGPGTLPPCSAGKPCLRS